MNQSRALIVGSRGQDGRLLTEWLEGHEYDVLGLTRENSDISDSNAVMRVIRDFRPNEIYYLAAHHHSSQEAAQDELDLWNQSNAIHFQHLLHFLEGLRIEHPTGKLFYAASSLLFGEPVDDRQTEACAFNPTTPYGVTKAAGLMACRAYRARHGLFASSGILFNHESMHRADKFVSKKIVKAAVAIQQRGSGSLVLGDLSANVDWGDARDYVEAMWRILQAPQSDDFVVSSGSLRTVAEFARVAFELLGLDWRKHVSECPDILKRRIKPVFGDSSKLTAITGWTPKRSFSEMIRTMLVAEGGQVV